MPTILVHGGVSGIDKEMPSLESALQTSSGSALDLVEESIRTLEDIPKLNAGFGAVLDREGRFELEAGIADGASGRAAGVTNVQVRHPISLARRVLERTPHVLLTGEGARAFGADLERLDRTTEERYEQWRAAQKAGELDLSRYGAPDQVDTVGAVVLDDEGRLAAGSSTGGVFGMLPGRVGDAPIFGAGFYASPRAAVVGTGVGELFLQTLACARVARMMEEGEHPQAAVEETVRYLGTIEPFAAGILALDAEGRGGAAFRGAAWAVAGDGVKAEAVRIAAS